MLYFQLNGVRGVADNAFSRLKGRWQILLKKNEHKIAFIPEIVTTCCILHNICEERNEPFQPDPSGLESSHLPAVPLIQGDSARAEQIRHALASYFFKNLQPSQCQSLPE